MKRPVNNHLREVKFSRYTFLDGSEQILVQKVRDGSIIKRFDRTPIPKKETDVVCPHFLELKWAYGCPFDCAWCFLKGTLRLLDTRTSPVIKDYCKIRKHLESFFRNDGNSEEILNSGEIADSLMAETGNKPFSRFIIPMFEEQDNHKILLVTKSTRIRNLTKIRQHEQVIVSFSVNSFSVAERWERAPRVEDRLKAAKTLSELNYETRLRIDPIVPVENWREEYLKLIDVIFENFVPERITLGSLRGLQSTINNARDKSWTVYITEKSNWGKKVNFKTRHRIYYEIIRYLKTKYNYSNVALCKETIAMWTKLGMDYRKIRCNCVR